MSLRLSRPRPRAVRSGRLGAVALLTLGATAALAGPRDSCTVSAVGPAFGTYAPLSGTPDDVNGMITVSCSHTGSGDTVTAVIGLSTGTSGSFATRKMLSGTQPLDYNLFADPAYTLIWGDGTGTSRTVTDTFVFTGGNQAQSATSTLYGQIPAGQTNVAAGSYSDTIVVTVSY